ncbi:hypothetical protein [Nonomuraea typhae]|uniref:hypothetical protein n=1 Tax=Nonomuraea typhae TaxID=2603600 RepID=UPI0012FB0D8D|nr:hypothetical protein [Nonomuraea typhae]
MTVALAGRGGVWVRAADLPNCGGDYFMPCKGQPWRLYLSNGKKVKFPDAARYATRADGSPAKAEEDSPAPFAVSGDGRSLAYVRARDGRVVVRAWPRGRRTVLPALGRATGTAFMTLDLSADGRHLSVDYSGAGRKRRPGLLVDTATGATVRTLPKGDRLLGFSADGDEVLAERALSDNTTSLIAHAADGSEVAAQPPQELVVTGVRLALEADGRTVVTAKDFTGVRRYDLAGQRWTGPARRIVAPRGELAGLGWGPGGRLEAVAMKGSDEDGYFTTVVYSLDPATGRTKKLDQWTIRPGVPR